MKKIILFFIISCFYAVDTSGQSIKHSLKGTIATIDSLHKRLPAEKLYMHLDKPYYAIGDTMRFKAYLLDEALYGSTKSGLLYVELINDSSRVVKRQTIKLYNGIARGDIIVKNNWYTGNYTLRSYTNWMRNFGEEHFFNRQISLVAASNQNWLVNNRVNFDKDKNVSLALQFSDLKHNTIGFQDMQLSILQGGSVLLKNKTRTDGQGNAVIKFVLPPNLGDRKLSLLAEDISKGGSRKKSIIPIQLNRPENIDLQFMPEGGSMIAGIPIKIGFKAINEDGKGTAISGKIINSKQQEIVTFTAAHKGMGSFEITPETGETYAAKVSLPDGTIKNYPLPIVNLSGIALRVGAKDKDSLELVITPSSDLLTATAPATYYLIGQARDKVCYGANLIFKDKIIRKTIATNVFPTGIIKFVLFDISGRPVSQRMMFVDHDDRLNISLNTNKESYSLRDSVGLELAVTNAEGKPVQGSFSLSVTDDTQVKPFDTDAENITSYMLLNPDIKGTIEEPGYYFNKEHTDRATALDNLLLTQGWASYDWKQVFEPIEKPKYEAEREFTVKGTATNIFNKRLANTEIMLLSKKPEILISAKTDTSGRFIFKNFPLLDTIDFRLQAIRSFNIGLNIDEFVPPEFTLPKDIPPPWYINPDSTLVSYVTEKQAEFDNMLDAKGKLLKTVEIKDQRSGPLPYIALTLNEEQIRNARTGPKPLNLHRLLNYNYQIGQMQKMLIIDGHFFIPFAPSPAKLSGGSKIGGTKIEVGEIPYWRFEAQIQINDWLDNFNTEDIKGFKITPAYLISTTGKAEVAGLIINVTTNLGRGDDASIMGGYVYRPMPISWPHKFYSPRYAINTSVTGNDRRSTIYWAPNIKPDVNGEAAGSFYSADVPGTYTIIVEGSDLNGNVGYYRKQIKVGSITNAAR